MKALHRAYQAHEASAKTLSSRQFGEIAIDTYVHVIQGRNASKSTSVPTSKISDQVRYSSLHVHGKQLMLLDGCSQ
jgi:hypothetical protein